MSDESHQVPKTWDHWWPRGIQRLWTNDRGYVRSVDRTEREEAKKPQKKKAERSHAVELEGHRIELNGPWTTSFESLFERIDNDAPKVLKELSTHLEGIEFRPRTVWKNLDLPRHQFWTLVMTVASMQIRSPRFRHFHGFCHPAFGGGWSNVLAKSNMQSAIRSFEEAKSFKALTPHVFLLRSSGEEFFFGDGSIDDAFRVFRRLRLKDGNWIPRFDGTSMISLTPNLAILLFLSSSDFDEEVRTCHMLDLPCSEVKSVNLALLAAFRERCYFRNLSPSLPNPWEMLGDYSTPDLAKLDVVLQCWSVLKNDHRR